MKAKLANILVDENLEIIDYARHGASVNAVQFDEMIDYVIQELGVDPKQIIKRAEWHTKQRSTNGTRRNSTKSKG